MKCRACCPWCHRRHNEGGADMSDLEFDQDINQKSTLKYSRSVYGNEHRTAMEVFDLKEMQSFILDLKSRGAFSKMRSNQTAISIKTLEVSLWMHFKLLLSDLLTIPSGDRWNDHLKRRTFTQTIIRETLKVLGVKCPNPNCEECFLNLRPNTRSAVEMNHKKPSDKLSESSILLGTFANIDRVIKESRKGELDGTCSRCHKLITRYQNGTAKKPSWYDGN